jgi:hypothetical protein
MTELEAKTRWCPFRGHSEIYTLLLAAILERQAGQAAPARRSIPAATQAAMSQDAMPRARCIGSGCMLWNSDGRCGLART